MLSVSCRVPRLDGRDLQSGQAGAARRLASEAGQVADHCRLCSPCCPTRPRGHLVLFLQCPCGVILY